MLTSLSAIVEAARARGPRRLAVAWGCDPHTLEAVAAARDAGIAAPVIYAPRDKVLAVAQAEGISLDGIVIVDSPSDVEAVRAAVRAVASGEADVLMKGLVSTDRYMRGILDKTCGLLPPGGTLSHVAVFELPGRGRLLVIGDVAVIPAPDFKQKLRILGYLASTARTLGIDRPRIACIAPSEQVLPTVLSSTEAAVIAKMGDRGQLGDVTVDGPLSLDVSLWPEVAAEKGVRGSSVAGEADCLLFPNIESGNVFFKCCTYMAGAEVAAMVVGTTAPCVLTSRGDSPRSKLCSIALACLSAK